MRLRYKKNLEERADACSNYFIDRNCPDSAVDAINNPNYVDFKTLFNNDNPVVLEIGCGKGKFAIEYAQKHPDQNVIAVERLTNVAVSGAEKAQQLNIPNLKFLVQNAEFLPHFLPNGSISKIFLNFSCPFPKYHYRNRRLTHPKFLAFYKDLLIDGGVVEQKTDNLPFFNFSIESFDGELWTILYKTNDLYSDDVSDNIQTEYERRFVSGGMTINKLIATPPKKDE